MDEDEDEDEDENTGGVVDSGTMITDSISYKYKINIVFVARVSRDNHIVNHCKVCKQKVFELIKCRWEEPWVGQRGTLFLLSNNKNY